MRFSSAPNELHGWGARSREILGAADHVEIPAATAAIDLGGWWGCMPGWGNNRKRLADPSSPLAATEPIEVAPSRQVRVHPARE